MVTFISRSPEDTMRLGIEWGRSAAMGWVIGLQGDLGAGKTQLVKGIAQGLSIQQRVHSPSFAIMIEYAGGRLPLYHIDLYRLESNAEIQGAGLDEYLFTPQGITVVEWIARWDDAAKEIVRSGGFLRQVTIEVVGDTMRKIHYEDFGA